ncbi:hypothetical protein D8M27_06985 [Corynebacterium pseudodiphtheriticum]|nr:hypothetical protein D8M37_07670 [Corynebacterium pseudodiphtheriticum]RUP94818.1 hypothetical protein D8M27_06985 [Corynebacterium pseudodiphtheriticum]RUP98989.1 hypothetical protein D8M32_06985 [Corynebacterium pseudodiphtheriticum]RUQ47478.1 hypothetical protein D8M30_07670 [Corynebacterium pseudodiphtheriticum]
MGSGCGCGAVSCGFGAGAGAGCGAGCGFGAGPGALLEPKLDCAAAIPGSIMLSGPMAKPSVRHAATASTPRRLRGLNAGEIISDAHRRSSGWCVPGWSGSH